MPQIDTIMSSKTAMLILAAVAFLVALLLVVVIVRMLFGGRLRIPGGRARQARLGIVDAFEFGQKRQLIIVRRDNTEHLIMIGGPNDLLIESEIVRVEARGDGRRDKQEMFPATSDARIPAPLTPAVDRPDPKLPDQPRAPTFDPALILPLPPGPSPMPTLDGPLAGEMSETPARTPTFPLPSRRPMPAPPRLPESVSRGDDVPPVVDTPPPTNEPAGLSPLPAPLPPPAAPKVGETTAPTTTPEPAVAAPAAPPRPAPPFLKPLPPRPPLRPLQRTTPQAPTLPASAPGAKPEGVRPASMPLKPRPPASTTVPTPAPKIAAAPPPPAPPASPPAPQDALESLEEEMAKLLGRGPG